MAKKKYKLLVGYSREASDIVDEISLKVALKKLESLQEGYDYEILEFNSNAERKAFMLGVDKGNGWDRPGWRILRK